MSKYITGLLFAFFLLNGCSSSSKTHKLYTIEIKDMKFVPDVLTANVGDTVMWLNRDIVAHDVTEEASKAWTSSVIPPGESWKMVILDSVSYYCSLHVIMKGKIEVD